MAQLAISAAGAAAGGLLGQPAIGWAIGAAVGGLLFAPREHREGPRLEDLTVQASTYGQPLPRYWGTYRAAGNLIWTDGLREQSHEQEHGKGGPSVTTTTYTYSASFAVSFGAGPISAIRRLWADGKLIFDLSDDADAETALATFKAAEAIRFYPGDESQERDPLIEAIEGTDNTPAYRGQCYVVFERLQLADYGNRIPNLTAEILAAGDTAVSRIDALDLKAATGMSNSVEPRVGGLLGSDGIAHLTMNEWSNTYADTTVSYWRVYLDGSTERRYRFEAHISDVPMTISSDVPAWATYDPHTGQGWIYLLGPDRVDKTVAFQIAGLPVSYAQRLDIRAGRAYFMQHDNGAPVRVYFIDLEGLDPTPQYVLEWPTDHVDGLLYKICPGDSTTYGLTNANKVIQFDESFGVANAYQITPTSAIQYDVQRDSTELIRGDRDGEIYIISSGAIHKWHDGAYSYLTVPSAYWIELSPHNGMMGWAIVGNLLASLEVAPLWASLDLRRYRLDALTPQAQALDAVVGDLLDETGLVATERDLSTLAGITVDGFSRTHPMTARAALEVLQRVYHFDLIESDWILITRRRGDTTPDMVLIEDDLGAGGGERLPHERTEELELPRRVSLDYLCAARDYQVNHQYAARTVTSARHLEQVSAPAVVGDDRARQIAETLLHDAWTARDRFALALPPKCIVLDPGDLIQINRANGDQHFLRVTDTGYVPAGAVALRAVAETPANYTQNAPGAPAAIPPKQIGYAGPTELHLLDLPALREADDDAGVYLAAAAHSSAWKGSQVFGSSDGGASYAARQFVDVQAPNAWCEGVLAAGPTTVWDEGNTLTVQTTATLYSVTEAQVLNGENHLAVGAHGRWEIVGYRNVADNGDGTWSLTGLLRGRRGTEHAVGQHQDRDRVILLDSAILRRLRLELAERGLERHYKPVTVGATLDATTAKAFTGDAEALKPYSPVHLAGSRNGAGDLSMTWVRRTRLGGEWLDYTDAPLNEQSEAYEVDVLDGANVVRTLTGLSTPAATYTAADQVTDFGSAQGAVSVKVYQLSASVGRGHPAEATL